MGVENGEEFFVEPPEGSRSEVDLPQSGTDGFEPDELGVLENIFTCRGEPGHEVVAVFDAQLVDRTLYDMERVPLHEELWGTEARWIDLSDPPEMPLYPDGLLDLLRAAV